MSAYIAELETRRQEGVPPTDSCDTGQDLTVVDIGENEPASAVPEWPAWPLDDLRRLAAGSTATTQRWARVMDVCAQQPGRRLPTTEVAERSGMSVTQWRDATRKISRHLKAHYATLPRDPAGHLAWPLHAADNPDHPGQVSWEITSEQADRWRRVRDEQR